MAALSIAAAFPFDGLSGVRLPICPLLCHLPIRPWHGMPMADAAAAAVDTLNYVVFLALSPPPRRHNKQMMMK